MRLFVGEVFYSVSALVSASIEHLSWEEISYKSIKLRQVLLDVIKQRACTGLV